MRWRASKPACLPLNESRMVPATMTMVPATMGKVTCSPSTTIASTLEMSGARLLMAAATEAPTFWMATTLKKRPKVVPTTPEKTKYGTASQLYSLKGTSTRTADQSPMTPTAMLIQNPA